MLLSQMPADLLQEIVKYALEGNPFAGDVLSVNKQFLAVGQPLLHARLRFRSINQLILFSRGTSPLACVPRSLSISLAGGSADFEVFKHLAAALERCRRSVRVTDKTGLREAGDANADGVPQIPLDSLSLRLHSHMNNPHLGCEALSLANPKSFVWMGHDPEHHFSTAIVPSATYHLIRALSTWTAIERITLTSMSFPSDEPGLDTPFPRDAPLLPHHTFSRT
ncbi:hypothetical protein BD414DRAFT_425992 [Trametes punicea]|nr:hypothetical protein BD414DRAFT_425992 [Trametes punicea]